MVETVLVAALLLTMAFGIVGVGRVVQARMAVDEVAREAATAAATANSAADAQRAGLLRGKDVADGYQLTNGTLQLVVDPGSFARGGQVTAEAAYQLKLGDLPLLQWTDIPLDSRHTEVIDMYRSRWPESPSP